MSENESFWEEIKDLIKSPYICGFFLSFLIIGVLLFPFACVLLPSLLPVFISLIIIVFIFHFLFVYGIFFLKKENIIKVIKSLKKVIKSLKYVILVLIIAFLLIIIYNIGFNSIEFNSAYLWLLIFLALPNALIIANHFEYYFIKDSKDFKPRLSIFILYGMRVGFFCFTMILIYFHAYRPQIWIKKYACHPCKYISSLKGGSTWRIYGIFDLLVFYLFLFIIPTLIFNILINNYFDKEKFHFAAVLYIIIVYILILYGVVMYNYSKIAFEQYSWILQMALIAAIPVGIKVFESLKGEKEKLEEKIKKLQEEVEELKNRNSK